MDTSTYAKLERGLEKATKRWLKAVKACEVLSSELKFRKLSPEGTAAVEYRLRKLEFAVREAYFLRGQAMNRCKDARALVKCAEEEARFATSGQTRRYQNAQQRTRMRSKQYEVAEEKRAKQRESWYQRERKEEEKEDRAREQRRERRERREEAKKERDNKEVEAAARWRTATESFFKTSGQPFPDPPSFCCTDVSCEAQEETRSLEACEHSIRTAFQHVVPKVDAKKERLRWHPDKFQPEHRKKARGVFCVLQDLYEKAQKKAERRAGS